MRDLAITTLSMIGLALVVGSSSVRADDAAKPEAAKTPSPCAETTSMSPTDLFKALSTERKLPEVHKDGSYVALQDKATFAMWTFTQDSQAAHPAVVCRVPIKNGDTITLDMVVNCAGPKKACDQLEYDFKELNKRMQLRIENQQNNAP